MYSFILDLKNKNLLWASFHLMVKHSVTVAIIGCCFSAVFETN